MRPSPLRPAWIVTGIALLLAGILAVDLFPFLRGGYGWRWPYDPPTLIRALPLLATTALYLGGAWWLLARTRRDRLLLAWSVLGTVVLTLAVLALRNDHVLQELFERTASAMTTGPHHAAAHLEWDRATLRNWPNTMAHLQTLGNRHAALSPPGLPLFYHLLHTVLADLPAVTDALYPGLLRYQCHNFNLLNYRPAEWVSAWFGMLMPLWTGLAVIPLYSVVRRLHDRNAARMAAAWWPLVPGVLMFAPNWNTAYPLLALVAFGLLRRGLAHPSGAWQQAPPLVAAGLVGGLLTFANISTVPLLGLFGFYALLGYLLHERRAPDPPSWLRPVIVGAWFGAGLVVPWALYAALTGGNPLAISQHAMASHLDLDRPYLPWLWLHVWEWALFCGLPLVALWLVRTVRGARDRWRGQPVLGLALLLTLLVLDVSGTARGETGRVWLYFAPFVLIAAVGAVRGSDVPAWRPWLAISVGQAALLLALAFGWDVIDTELTPPPDPLDSPALAHPASATVDDTLRLRGWEAQVTDGAIVLRLHWASRKRPTEPYWFSALLVAPDGEPLPEAAIWQPYDAAYPATCWAAGEQVGDKVRLPLPDGAAPGEWWISLSVLDYQDYTPLPLRLPDGSPDTQIGLGPVRVP